jgi:hypothetical protein
MEMVRTGIVAMRRGSKSAVVASIGNNLAHAVADDDVSYSV